MAVPYIFCMCCYILYLILKDCYYLSAKITAEMQFLEFLPFQL